MEEYGIQWDEQRKEKGEIRDREPILSEEERRSLDKRNREKNADHMVKEKTSQRYRKC